MSPGEIDMICDRLDRIENKLDEYTRCQGQKVTRAECDKHREGIWAVINSHSKKIWAAVGALGLITAIVLPIALKIWG